MFVKDLSFRYTPFDEFVFLNTSFSFSEGITLITAPNSSGKTTLSRIFSGSIPALYKGEIKGVVELGERKKGIFIPQENELILMYENVRDEVEFFTNIKDFRFKRSDDFFKTWGLEHIADKKSSQLSAGEKQRYIMSFSLSFYTDGLIVMDEPFSHLDDRVSSFMKDFIKVIKDKIVIIFSHYFDGIEDISNRICRIENKRIVEGKGDVKESIFYLEDSNSGRVILEIKNLKHPYIKSKLNMSVREGEIKVIYGPNGSGKTTLMKIIAGYVKNYDGKVELRGISKSDIFYIPSEPDKIIFFHRVCDAFKSYDSCDNAFIEELSLKDKLKKPVSHLSYGDKQKLLLAMALVSKKKLIMIDEPIMSFDGKTANSISKILKYFTSLGGSVIISVPSKKIIKGKTEIIEI